MSKNSFIILVIVIIIVLAGIALYATHQNASSSGAVATTTASGAVQTGSTGTTGSGGMTHTGGTTPVPAPHITKFLPPAGTPGTSVTIIGTGFSKTENYVMFGPTADHHHIDGSPDNQIAKVGSPDGTSITFTVPASGPSGQLCDVQNHCVAISSILLTPGNYPVRVRTQGGLSNSDLFVLTK
ncbi:MAG TPA: IPT/TIG domain-containing protein [Candidatus Paceibacterota bacterium]|jgi:hypothetical protein|nr:IPT/TIG domain-containing protein [Candidatus Paceibacterota bacterium]